ncbi:MAG: hypothetical protein WCA46_18060, partial [Actinocatenispora sp.]
SVLAEYSPEYPCLTSGMVALQRRISDAFGTGRLHISLEITRDSGKYVAGDEPQNLSDSGPNCRGLPGPPSPFPSYQVGDGYQYGTNHPGGPVTDGGATAGGLAIPGTGGQGGGDEDLTMGYSGTSEERHVVNPLVAAATGRDVTRLGDIDDLLWGPLMRGAVVNAS